jgi:hypothetical protein
LHVLPVEEQAHVAVVGADVIHLRISSGQRTGTPWPRTEGLFPQDLRAQSPHRMTPGGQIEQAIRGVDPAAPTLYQVLAAGRRAEPRRRAGQSALLTAGGEFGF